ncbi:alpha-amylase family glycosyl hydrolase [Piscibacillus sp. B03]|uniref:alpha-amylase family glycosyl hydrolase n=1 Tax=Piscibacillus sp. B03 TaxID=3457430 RepID=UPI003FCE9310
MRFYKTKSLIYLTVLLMLIQPLSGHFSTPSVHADEREAFLVGSFGSDGDSTYWNPSSSEFQMTNAQNGHYYLEKTLPAGTYEYKIAINGSWDENYGANGGRNGSNMSLTLEEETTVRFVYNDESHVVTTMVEDKQPRLVGNLQPAIDAGDEWSPETSTAILTDDNNDNIYEFNASLSKGDYEFKIVLGSSWGEDYPSSNVQLSLDRPQELTFYYNHETKAVYTSLDADQGDIDEASLFHNSWDETYRTPFGAAEVGESVTLRFAAKKDDLEKANLHVKNYTTGDSEVIPMSKSGWSTVDGQELDFWEAKFTPSDKGVHGYKFIAYDGEVVKEYGEDAQQGKTGRSGDTVNELFQLTVYDPEYQTPDWMKEAVVYQIFPDRFYNGNPDNDEAKSNARGDEPIEHHEWDELPDNPRLAGTAGYEGDGFWSNDFYGGDVKGVHEKLDYIQSLGVNTIYLNPIAHAASNHKYDATDFKAIDPMFGSPEEFKAFTDELKERGMHLILDGVFNHVGDDSIYFDRYGKYETVGAYEYWSRIYDLMNEEGLTEEEAKAQAEEEFKDEGQVFSPYGFHNWFNIKNTKVDVGQSTERYDYQGWWGFDSLPEIASIPGEAVPYESELNNEPFANYIMYEDDSVAKSWLNRGGSGWRLDVANEVDTEFWREFRDELKQIELDQGGSPLILGEIWDDASKYFLGDLYDSVMNYRFRGAVIDFLRNGKEEEAMDQLMAVQEDYPDEAFYNLMNLMGSHDTVRAVYVLGNGSDTYERAEDDPNYDHELGLKRLKLAAIFQYGYAGAPTVYYGDEAGVTGSKDPDDRRTYPWGSENDDLIKHYQELGDVRESNKALFTKGSLTHLYAKNDVVAYGRQHAKKYGVVVMNRSNEEKVVTIDTSEFALNGVQFKDELNQKYTATTKDGKLEVTLPPMSGRMLVSKPAQVKEVNQVAKLEATEGEGQVTLSWKGKKGTYHVYQTNVDGTLYEKVAETTKQTIEIDSLDNGRAYYFAITRVDQHGNESEMVQSEKVIPHIPLENYEVTNVTELDDGTINLAEFKKVEASILIDGYTDHEKAEGLEAKLQYKQAGASSWEEVPAKYIGQDSDSNVFEAKFLPIEVGEYEYRYAFTTDQGREYVYTDSQTFNVTQSDDQTPPADAVTLDEPLQESGQVNLTWSVENEVDPYMIGIYRDDKLVHKLWDTSATSYRDVDVMNGETYSYVVALFDQNGNVVRSNEVSVTPQLVTVDVTFKVSAPDYTPLDATLTIPNSMNGWNTSAWEMSRAGAVTPDWQYTVQAQVGEVITYKYVRDGSWDREGLADHTRENPTDDDISYYGYGAEGTDLQLVVENQGNNKMVVEDTILRWVDQPVVVTSHSNGQSVSEDTVTLSGNAIKEGVLTINGEPVTIQDDMSWSHEVTLQDGENQFNIHIEPTEENKSEIFNNDGGAISKNTKDIEFTLNRE